ncbi:MAG: DUF2202 domain-containing protein [Synergistota bacterium]|nr:DUF2202 domain-containing protein [Synergistota bacterium]
MVKRIALFALCVLVIGASVSAANTVDSIAASAPLEELSREEIDGLLQMREEEKLARDVYTALYAKWKLPIFRNIAESEQQHTDMVKTLLGKYELQDPMKNDTPGVFEKQELQSLYDNLVARGSGSLSDALLAGAAVEDLDIYDLEELMQSADNADIRIVYQNLMKGSRNHLRSFAAQIAREGKTYRASYLTQEAVDDIVHSPRERGVITDPDFVWSK